MTHLPVFSCNHKNERKNWKEKGILTVRLEQKIETGWPINLRKASYTNHKTPQISQTTNIKLKLAFSSKYIHKN